MFSKIRSVFAGVLVLSSSYSYCQVTKADTSFLVHAKNKSIALYTSTIQHQSRLYNGSDYIIYFPKDEEHPYYHMDDWGTGSVVYWDELYENIPLLFDLTVDQVITEHDWGSPIKLIPEKVRRFVIWNHTFVRLYPDNKNKISEGFYDQLYDGKSKVYARYTKAYREEFENTRIIPQFDESTRYYLVKNGVFNIVKSKASVLQVLSDHKPEIKDFLRKNRIWYKDNRATSIVRIAEFYDTLID